MDNARKVMTVVGARPQFIKAAPVSWALRKSSRCREVMVHTGQHYDRNMSDTFFEELDISPPEYNLGVGSFGHAEQTGEIMKRLEPILANERPEILIVYGDTNSTLAAAITASKLNIPVAHIEAGLRSYNRIMPEEVNRVVADHVSTLLFCPTTSAVQNLAKEGIMKNVFKTGDVMYDAALAFSRSNGERDVILPGLDLERKGYILATIHRAENTESTARLTNIFTALDALSRETTVVLPLHPRTRKMIKEFRLEDLLERLNVLEPVGFLDMISLESNASLILTDSGGVQKEAYFYKVPCVTVRDETEWVETVETNWNVLADADDAGEIIEKARASVKFSEPRADIAEYGDGRTSTRIVAEIENHLFGSAGA